MNFIEAIDGGKYEVFEPDYFKKYMWPEGRYIYLSEDKNSYKFDNNAHFYVTPEALSYNNWQRRPKPVVPPEGYELVPKGEPRPRGHKVWASGWIDGMEDKWVDGERIVGIAHADLHVCAPIPGTCYWAKAQMDNGEKVTCSKWKSPYAFKTGNDYLYANSDGTFDYCEIEHYPEVTDFRIYVPPITQEQVDDLCDAVMLAVEICYDPFNEDSDAEQLRLIREKYADYSDLANRFHRQNNP